MSNSVTSYRLILAFLFLGIVLAVGLCRPQASRPSFEVASIKPGDPHGPIKFSISGRRFIWENTALKDVILWAYHVAAWQLSGGPGWLESERYDIQGIKPEGFGENINPSQDEQLMSMVRGLLEERCKLRINHQTKVGSVFELTIAKIGPELNPAAETDDPNAYRGVGDAGRTSHGVILVGKHASMADMAFGLSRILTRPVLNRTKMEGVYDFQLEYSRRDEDDAPSIFAALRDRLGLKLSAAKGRVDTLFINSIQRPSAN